MQKVLFLIAICFATFSANAQKVKSSKLPVAVKGAFKVTYPSIKEAKWNMEGADYEASFDNAEGKDVSVVITPTGMIKETEVEITFSELPAAAQAALKGKKVKETAKITDVNGNVKYEAEVGRKDILFDSQGVMLK